MPVERNLRDGDRRNVTVLFADMKDFTSLSEQMDPEEMDSLMNQVFSTFEAVVHRHGGNVEKYIGDALVAVFGVPNLHEDDPARAVNSALDILDEITRINYSLTERRLKIGFRIGINTGLITTGRRGEHDVVTGHAMSVASRLQSEAAVNSVLIAASTHDHCAESFVFSEARQVGVKGKSETITCYEVLDRATRPVDRDTVFVGRKEIIDDLFRRYLRHDPGETEGFIIAGDAGIGKTRLVSEVLNRCRQLPDFHSPVLYARAMRYRSEPFSVVVDLLSGYFGLRRSAGPDTTRAAIIEKSGVEERTVDGFVDLVSGDSSSHDNEAFVLLYLVLKDVVKQFASEPYPSVLVVENLHFMDRQSRDFFRFFLKNADVKPFFLMTDRHPDPGISEVFSSFEIVNLPPLSREESLRLIDETCPTGDSSRIGEETRNSIVVNSQGNPLFIREYVRFAAENRDTTTLPTTIQNIFLTSIDPLDPPMRDLLKKLSVFVHSFSLADAQHVHSVTDGDPRIVEPAIGFFLRESILVQENELFMFRHDVFKTALYDSLLNYNKRVLHKVIADRMIEKGNPHALRLLYHLVRAEEYEQATERLWGITGLTGNMDYLPYIDILLEKVGGQSVDTYLNLGFVKSAILFNNGKSDEADLLLKDMIEIALQENSALYAGSAYHLLTAYNMKSYCFEKARFCGTNGLAYYRTAGAETKRIQNLLEIMASSEMLRNRSDEVERIVSEIETSDEFGSFEESATQLAIFRAEYLLMCSEYREARELLESQVSRISPESENWLSAHLMLGLASFHLCDWRELLRVDLTLLDGPSRHYGNISQVNSQIAVAHHFLGDQNSAEQRLQQAEFNASQVKNDFDLLDAYRTLSESYMIMGHRDKAGAIALPALSIGMRHSATYPVLTLLMILTEIAFDAGRREETRFLLTEAGLLLDRGVLLRNRDVALYYHFRSRMEQDEELAGSWASEAQKSMRREMENLGDDEYVSALLRIRSYGQIAGDVFDGEPDAGAAS